VGLAEPFLVLQLGVPRPCRVLCDRAGSLIVKIEYRWQMIFVKDLLTHAEYDRKEWTK
jgi:hypothetical protein